MKLIYATIATTALLLAGCSSTDDETTATSTAAPSAATTTEASDVKCDGPIPIEDPDVSAAVSSVQLPADATVTTVRISKDSDEPGMVAVAIDVCDPAVTDADALRPIATQYAKALHDSALSDQIFAVYVASYQVNGKAVVNEHKIKVDDFQMYLWNGKPSESAELANWKVVTP